MMYTETQKYTQRWLWAILVIIFLSAFYPLFHSMMLDTKTINSPTISYPLIINLIIVSGIFAFFLFARMDTEIDNTGVHIRHMMKTILLDWSQIDTLEPVTITGFNFGWGYIDLPDFGKVYRVKGNKGILVTKTDGTKFTFGTQNPDKIMLLVEELQPNKK